MYAASDLFSGTSNSGSVATRSGVASLTAGGSNADARPRTASAAEIRKFASDGFVLAGAVATAEPRSQPVSKPKSSGNVG
jgi:hypothetical protein